MNFRILIRKVGLGRKVLLCFNVVVYVFFSLHLQRGPAYQDASRVRKNFELVYLNLNEVLVLRKKTQWMFAYKLEKTDSLNRNEFITQDSIKIVNALIVHLVKVTFISRN